MAPHEVNAEGASTSNGVGIAIGRSQSQDSSIPGPSTSNGTRAVLLNKNCKGKPKRRREDLPFEGIIRVGKDYQVKIPQTVQPIELAEEEQMRDLLVWAPNDEISDEVLDEFVAKAQNDHGYNGEQALGMLFWHKNDLERAKIDLGNFTPYPDDWSDEERQIFDQAFLVHGKEFHKIQLLLPDKSIASLLRFYYTNKKGQSDPRVKQLIRLYGEGNNGEARPKRTRQQSQ